MWALQWCCHSHPTTPHQRCSPWWPQPHCSIHIGLSFFLTGWPITRCSHLKCQTNLQCWIHVRHKRSNICPLKRQTRKRLFKYRIWYNHVKHDCFPVDMNYPCCDPEPISVRINSDHHIRNKNKVPRFKALTRIERDNSFYVTQQVSHLHCALLNVRSLKN